MRSERYQIALITFGLLATALFAYFLYKEVFPEYKIYQHKYVALEDFRSDYTGEPPPDFKLGVKQIVFERQDKGPEKIDRCISCHVAVQLPHFSPTKIAYDVNGNIVRSIDGTPVHEPNENYVWGKLNQKIAELKDEKVNDQLIQEGQAGKVKAKLRQAEDLEALKTAKVGHATYDVTKVLAMHPLIGKETRPFEFHPIDEYGCTSCHSGNGRGLTTEKAHGPVFDGQYEAEYMGYKPDFTERDSLNDPKFSQVFNHKPGDALLFQTTPILVGNLIQSSCIQCHEQSAAALQGLADTAGSLTSQRIKKTNAIEEGYRDEKEALIALIELKQSILTEGLKKTIADIKQKAADPRRSAQQRLYDSQQAAFLEKFSKSSPQARQTELLKVINKKLISMLGSEELIDDLTKKMEKDLSIDVLDNFLNENSQNEAPNGTLFEKLKILQLEKALLKHVKQTENSFSLTASDENTVAAMTSDIDVLTKNFRRGQQLYLSQACYACHRIAGFARGGVGPELTQAGATYPWYLKESIVWPQADLRTSTMPNFMLDHVELEDLMTFLLAQQGATKAVSQTEYKLALQQWEAGRKMVWEKPIAPSEIHNLRYGMTVFATEGCAACHRLEGFESNVGYAIEKNKDVDFENLYKEKEWFRSLFPEEMLGSSIVAAIEKHTEEIDKRIVNNVRKDSILENLNEKYPEAIEALYSNFRFASRAKNYEYMEMAASSEKKKEAMERLKSWQERVNRVLMMYIQEYGLGRLVGPRPNWAGVYRTDEWLMEHFHNPSAHVARSIMPVFPFDNSKFYALTYMLDVLGKRNRDQMRMVWDHKGFQPDAAFQLLCAQCHGEYLLGNGSVAAWIYPIPKNLRNAEFLRNLTRENVIDSIMHGVKGTPMPPWGEAPQPKPDYDGIPILTHDEILKLVDWLYSSLPGGTVIKSSEDVPKWHYQPQDVIDELKREGNILKPDKNSEDDKPIIQPKLSKSDLELLSTKKIYYAALDLKPSTNQVQNQDVETIFDVKPNPLQDGDKDLYYIKKRYYTKENIEKGQDFFELNCSVCHGAEADGSGIRASVMLDAKPRMLTNLDWIKTRDDMRLIRSIKYGVAGTAMTPWGDLTSSLQRLQLVIFIRTLSQEKEKRDALLGALYAAFEVNQNAVEGLRIIEYPKLATLLNEYSATKSQLAALSVNTVIKERESRLALYQKQLDLEQKLNQAKSYDQLLIDLKGLIGKQKEIYQGIGNDMISANIEDEIWQKYLKLIALNNGLFNLKDSLLSMVDHEIVAKKLEDAGEEIAKTLEQHQAEIKKQLITLEGKFPTPARDEETKTLQAKFNTLERIKGRLLSGIQEDILLKRQEKVILQEAQEFTKKDEQELAGLRQNIFESH